MTDGPLIVQSRQDAAARGRPRARRTSAGRRSRRSPSSSARPSTSTPTGSPRSGLWNARAAGHDAEQVVDALLRYSPLRRAARAARRRRRHDGPLRAAAAAQRTRPTAWCCDVDRPRRCSRRCCAARRSQPLVGARIDDDTVVVHPCERGHLKQVLLKLGWPAEDLAGYVDGEAHPIDAATRTAGRCAPTSARRSRLLARRLRRRRAALRRRARRSSARRRWRGRRRTTLILVTNTVAGRQWQRRAARAHLADRGRDRRVLRRPQGDPAGHHRDVPGADHAAEGRLRRTSSCSTRATGA